MSSIPPPANPADPDEICGLRLFEPLLRLLAAFERVLSILGCQTNSLRVPPVFATRRPGPFSRTRRELEVPGTFFEVISASRAGTLSLNRSIVGGVPAGGKGKRRQSCRVCRAHLPVRRGKSTRYDSVIPALQRRNILFSWQASFSGGHVNRDSERNYVSRKEREDRKGSSMCFSWSSWRSLRLGARHFWLRPKAALRRQESSRRVLGKCARDERTFAVRSSAGPRPPPG